MTSSFIQQAQQQADQALNRWLNQHNRLESALHYSVFNGGKRLRPALVYAVADYQKQALSEVDNIAVAIELIHCYSLVHDDLPAMDDDDLRRGKPTCHIQFDEATAILAGDALQALAFEALCQSPYDAQLRLATIEQLSKASGRQGMVLGQHLDLEAEQSPVQSATALANIHAHKTGALIKCSIQMAATVLKSDEIDKLCHFSDHLGLAFQIQDDILDVTSSTDVLGKPQGADAARDKSTYVSLLGLEGAKAAFAAETEKAWQSLQSLNQTATALEDLFQFIIKRNH